MANHEVSWSIWEKVVIWNKSLSSALLNMTVNTDACGGYLHVERLLLAATNFWSQLVEDFRPWMLDRLVMVDLCLTKAKKKYFERHTILQRR